MAQTNMSILTHAWLEGTNDFQQLVPNPVQAGYAASVRAMDFSNPQANQIWNYYYPDLNYTIGQTLIDAARWNTPFNRCRLANTRWGHGIREILPKWLKAHARNANSTLLDKVFPPGFEQWFYTINFDTVIPWDMNRNDVLQSMNEGPDSMGVNDLYWSEMVSAYNSDEYNIHNTCLECFTQADETWGEDGKPGLFRVKVDAGTSKKDLAMNLLEAIRKYLYILVYPSKLYNHVDVPVFAFTGQGSGAAGQRNEMMLFTDAETMAITEVDAYAELFNVDEARMRTMNMVLPELPLVGGGALGILTTDSFIHWHDYVYAVDTFYDASTRNDKFYLHHQAAIAPNPAVPIIVFDQNGTTLVPVVSMTASKIKLDPESETVAPGGKVDMNPELVGTVDENDGEVGILPDSATFTVSADKGFINSKTYVDRFGTLHLQKSGLPNGAVITVTASATYINPSKRQATLTATATLTVQRPAKPVGTYTVTYDLAGDETYGIPSDGQAPETVIADAGVTVQIAPKLETAWTTSDGTDSGVPGTWTFAGWNDAASGGNAVTEVSSIAADTTVYGAWTFSPTV